MKAEERLMLVLQESLRDVKVKLQLRHQESIDPVQKELRETYPG